MKELAFNAYHQVKLWVSNIIVLIVTDLSFMSLEILANLKLLEIFIDLLEII